MSSKRSISILIVCCALIAVVILFTMPFRAGTSMEQNAGTEATLLAEGIALRASIPDKIVRGQPYVVGLLIEEQEGQPRTITGIRIEGHMLTRALQPGFTQPSFVESNSNIADGWIENIYSLPLAAESTLAVTISADAKRVGLAEGALSVDFDDGSAASIPISYEIVEQ